MELLPGILLLALGAGMLVAEAHLPTGGLLGAGGVAALAAGSVLALTAAGAGAVATILVAVAVAGVSGAVLALATRAALRASHRRPWGGPQGLVGHVGVIRRAPQGSADQGAVFVDGALWRAVVAPEHLDEEPLRSGDPVIVERVNGLTVTVRRADPLELPS